MTKIVKIAAVMLCIISSEAILAEDFNNESVIALSEAGLDDDVILSKIDALACQYDVSTDALIHLRTSGVSGVVITAMVQRCIGAAQAQGSGLNSSNPTVMRSPGIYLDTGGSEAHNLMSLRPIMASGGQMTGNGSLLFPFRARVSISGNSSAQATSTNRPVFYFYFETDDRRVGDFGSSATTAAQSPNEFSLARFRVRDGQRQLTVARGNMFNANVGLDPEDLVNLSIQQIGDGIFEVTPAQELEPGQYGFVLRMGSDAYRIFDFSVGGAVTD